MAEYPSGYARPTNALVNPVGAVRKDVGAVIADTDGDFGELQTDAVGNLRVTQEGGALTYSCAFDDLVAASTADDLVRISGSASKTVFVQEIRLSATATSAKTLDVRLMRRSAANSGGTATQPTVVKHSTDDAAGTAVVDAYTANSTPGAAVGIIRSRRYTIAAVDGVQVGELVFDLRGYNGGKGVRLEGVAQGLSVELDGETAGSGNSWAGSITWIELPTTA